MNNYRTFLSLGALGGFLSVALGAFGAHLLRDILDANHLAIFHTGVTYQFYHSLALILIAILIKLDPDIRLQKVGLAFAVGIVIFSGSLYALAITGYRPLGAITPIGGVSFLAGWALLAYRALAHTAKS